MVMIFIVYIMVLLGIYGSYTFFHLALLSEVIQSSYEYHKLTAAVEGALTYGQALVNVQKKGIAKTIKLDVPSENSLLVNLLISYDKDGLVLLRAQGCDDKGNSYGAQRIFEYGVK
ncbi:MAG TPA: hypothetical protein VHA52_12325 [Candidatus Babeliaceae bacterium]|nr:hypothetical protein [Candidatus Babeliaceae bacterium]